MRLCPEGCRGDHRPPRKTNPEGRQVARILLPLHRARGINPRCAQTGNFGACKMKHQRHFESANGASVTEPVLSQGDVVKQHIILGVNERDIVQQKDLWLSENPFIKVLKVHRIRREPRNLLSRLGGPRFSVTIDYEEPDLPATVTADVGRRA
jgi:hypothetical protein